VDIRERQAPLRERYTNDPATAIQRLVVRGGHADLTDPLHVEVGPARLPGLTWRSGLPERTSVTAAAAALRVSRPALSSLLNGRADLSGDMALRIEKAFGVKMDMLLRMQVSYDIAQTRKRAKQIHVRRVSPMAAAPA
jgi:addiction module HigA family antidote